MTLRVFLAGFVNEQGSAMPSTVTDMSINGLSILGMTSPTCVVGDNDFKLAGSFPVENGKLTIPPTGICFTYQDGPTLYASTIDPANSGAATIVGKFDYPYPGEIDGRAPRKTKLSVTVSVPAGPPSPPFPANGGGWVWAPSASRAADVARA